MQISPRTHLLALKNGHFSIAQLFVFSLPIILGLGLGFLIWMGDWHFAFALVALVPLAIIFSVRPFVGVIVWLLFMPLSSALPDPRLMFWIFHRLLVPFTLIMALFPHLLKAPRVVRLKLGLPELAIAIMIFLVMVSIFLIGASRGFIWNKYIDRLLIPLCMYLAVRFITPDDRDMKILQWTAFAIIITQSTIGFMSWVTPQLLPRAWHHLFGARTAGSLLDPAVFTSLLIFCAMLLFHAAIQEKSRQIRLLFLLACVVSYVCVFISLERGSWLAGSLVLLGLFVLYPKVIPRFLLIAAVVIALTGGLFSKQIALAGQRMGDQNPIDARIVVTDAMLQMIRLKPVFGWGYDTLDLNIRQFYRQVGFAFISMQHRLETSHNTYLTILTELGIVGFFLYMLPIFCLVVESLRVWRVQPRVKPAWIILLSTLWLAALHNFVVSNFMDMRFFPIGLTLWWMTLALIANSLSQNPNPQASIASKRVPTQRRHDHPLAGL